MKRFFAVMTMALMVSVAVVHAQQKGQGQKSQQGSQQKGQQSQQKDQGQKGGGGGGGQGTQAYKINKDDFNNKISKSDAAIADPKKNAKAATWIDRGDLFVNVALAPVANVYRGMPVTSATVLFSSKPSSSQTKVGGMDMTKLKFPYFEAYTHRDNAGTDIIVFYRALPSAVIDQDASQKAYDAFDKAWQLDPKSASKVKKGMMDVTKIYASIADNAFGLNDFATASQAFAKAYEVQRHPAVNIIDTVAIYNAGLAAAASGNWADGQKYFKIAYDLKDYNKGELFHYMYHCFKGAGDVEVGKKFLFEGLDKFPSNNQIIEDLFDAYSQTGEDPSELIPAAQKALDSDPKNPMLWEGLGRIYFKLEQQDKAIEAFQHVVELKPNDYDANFNLGIIYVKYADVVQKENSKKSITSQAEADAATNAVLDQYANALPYFEKAHELNSKEFNPVDFMRMISYRLQTRPGMKEKYAQYAALYDQMKAEQAPADGGGDQ